MDTCAFLCGLYLQLGAAALQTPPPPKPPDTGWYNAITRPQNPYGTIEIGWQSWENKGFRFELAVRHMSGSGQDYGVNTAEMRVRWRPWHD